MIKIPLLNKYMTDDQSFFDAQVNEEFKYCNNENFYIQFEDIKKHLRIFRIVTKDKKAFILPYRKIHYKFINETLATLRLNMALHELDEITWSVKKGETATNKHGFTVTITTLEDLLINGKPLLDKETAIQKLIEKAKKQNGNDTYLDFYEQKYDNGIQNYLILYLYKNEIKLDEQLINAISYYKLKDPSIYYLVNLFLEGNFDELFKYLESIDNKVSLAVIVKIARNIIQALDNVPDRDYDIMIYRGELNLDKTQHENNLYDKFVSFGTCGGTLYIPDAKDPVMIKRILKKDDKAIPIDILENLGLFYVDCTNENEMLLPPFTYTLKGKEIHDNFDTYLIEETSKINPIELLRKRIDELITYLKEKNQLEEIKSLEELPPTLTKKRKTYIPKTNIKDIYYGIRPQ